MSLNAKEIAVSQLCLCCSNRTYQKCCGLFINEGILPPTPEALMRSRYTAYASGKIEYIKDTMRGNASVGFDPEDALQWAQSVEWLGLEVVQTQFPDNTDERGFVEFVAKYSWNNKEHKLHELSEFKKIAGQWYYVAGSHV